MALMVHLVLLGALTHAVLVWSTHFTQTLLKTRDDIDPRGRQSVRLGMLFAGASLVFVGVPTQWWWLTLAGACVVVAAVAWHAAALWARLRSALPGRFRVTIRYYLLAAASLPVGVTFGVLLARQLDSSWPGRLLVAHSATMLLGWIGLTLTGTLVTLWPTMLRTRMDDRAEALARQALPVLVAAIVVIDAGTIADLRFVALAGVLVYLAGLAWWGRALWLPARAAGLRSFATLSVAAALCWAVVALVLLGVELATRPTWSDVAERYGTVAGLAAAAFGVQLLTGALSYLIPSVLGGGPSVVRAGQAWFDRWATFRVVVINLGVLVWLLPVGSWAKVTTTTLVLVVMALFLPLMAGGVRASVAARRELDAAREAGERRPQADRPSEPVKDSAWRPNQAIAAVAAVALAVSVGLAVPTAPSVPTSSSVTPTGQTTAVEVNVEGMAFVPNRIEVPAGNRLVVTLRNTGSDVHDLSFGDAATPRLAPGNSATLDVGVIGADRQGWCTVVGHRQMGMVLDVVAVGAPTASGHDHGQSTTSSSGVNLHKKPDPAFTPVDASLAPAPTGTVHRRTITVTEGEREVAPGVKQLAWTFDGAVPGPTLRGKVGDTFEITLVNKGMMGHSIDFHASWLAPDEPMRTIQPGETLVFTFVAHRAGIWMYHCSTMPMSAHIAAGMFGAVIIDPPGLTPVDKEFVLVQSDVYLDGDGTTARPVDAAKAKAGDADAVVFNGYAFGYKHRPLQVGVGERVRFWVLDVGPNKPSSFHIVGTQFDTVFKEGGYQLRRGVDAFGTTSGGSQALGLLAAQGGFVEAVFPEAGHYPMVSHIMGDAELGATGIVEVR